MVDSKQGLLSDTKEAVSQKIMNSSSSSTVYVYPDGSTSPITPVSPKSRAGKQRATSRRLHSPYKAEGFTWTKPEPFVKKRKSQRGNAQAIVPMSSVRNLARPYLSGKAKYNDYQERRRRQAEFRKKMLASKVSTGGTRNGTGAMLALDAVEKSGEIVLKAAPPRPQRAASARSYRRDPIIVGRPYSGGNFNVCFACWLGYIGRERVVQDGNSQSINPQACSFAL